MDATESHNKTAAMAAKAAETKATTASSLGVYTEHARGTTAKPGAMAKKRCMMAPWRGSYR